MIKIINTLETIPSVFTEGHFSMELWNIYMDQVFPEKKEVFLRDLEDILAIGDYSYEEDVLPVLQGVFLHTNKVREATQSFAKVTEQLDSKTQNVFGRVPNVTVVLYLGLCNGAGWVTEIQGETYILLGIEKIVELDWCDVNSMYGLIYHELGHTYHRQFGKIPTVFSDSDSFLWQLFSEGIAMNFESKLVGIPYYFHQDVKGWKLWCDMYYQEIKTCFREDLPEMNQETQCYFGDWVSFDDHCDVGYYLGARFIGWLEHRYTLDEMICFEIEKIRLSWEEYSLSEA